MAEVALKWPEKASVEANSRDALAIAGQMETLVTSLLAIARSQAGATGVHLQRMDLVTLLRQCWQHHAAAAEEKALHVSWNAGGEPAVISDPGLLGPLLDNLISNAVTYTPSGGEIEFAMAGLELTMSNSCSDLEAQDLPHLFEAFWRKDKARTSGAHCGLGLALVAAYAEAMKITLKAELGARDRFVIRLKFPGG